MSAEVSVTCDGCGEAIRGNPMLHRNEMLVLTTATPPVEPSNTVYGIYVHPIMEDGARHFHGLGCLGRWMEERLKKAS